MYDANFSLNVLRVTGYGTICRYTKLYNKSPMVLKLMWLQEPMATGPNIIVHAVFFNQDLTQLPNVLLIMTST